MYSVDIYNRVRRACLKDGMSAREAARYFNKDRKTIAKMLRHELPPGYQRSEPPRRPTLDGFVGVIDEILRTDKALIKKQRHTAKRIFERLRDEHGYAGSLTTVTYYVREQKRRTKEVFVARILGDRTRVRTQRFTELQSHYLFDDKFGRPARGNDKGNLPDVFATLHRLLEARMGKPGKREYVQVLRLLETFEMNVVQGAVQQAIDMGAIGYDAVKHLVLCRVEKRPPRLDLDFYPYLPRANVGTTRPSSYMSLIGGTAA